MRWMFLLGMMPMLAAPCEVGMVVRAGALNYDAKILAFNPATGLYKVEYVTGFKGTVEYVGPKALKTCQAPEMTPVAEPWFVGVWQLTTGGGGAWAKNPTTGSWKVVGLDVAGAPPIRIVADGTYEWVIDSKDTVRGRWRTAAAGERKYGYEKRGTVILLERGESGKDWLVSREVVPSDNERDRILIERVDLGLTYWGRRVGSVSAAPVLRKGNVTLRADAAKWTVRETGAGFRMETKDQKGIAVLQVNAAEQSARGYAETMLAQMRKGDANLRVVEQGQRTLNGAEAVTMRVEMTRGGQKLAYSLVFVPGAALVSWAAAENFGAYAADFAALAEGLHLVR